MLQRPCDQQIRRGAGLPDRGEVFADPSLVETEGVQAHDLLKIGDDGLAFMWTATGVGGLLAAGVTNRLAARPQLSAILAHIDRLREVDTDAIEPTAQVVQVGSRLREDLPEPSLPQERALANAPETKDGFFVVKAIQESEP